MYLGNPNIHTSLAGAGAGYDFSAFSPKSSMGEVLGGSPVSGGVLNTALGGLSLGGKIGLGLHGFNSVLGLVGLGVGLWSTGEQLKTQREALKLARQQMLEENRRYEAREKERLEANNVVAQSAQAYNPMQRE